MRTQLVSTLLRARPATVSCVTPRLARASSNTHHRETFESFTERYVNLFFQSAEELFEVEVQRVTEPEQLLCARSRARVRRRRLGVCASVRRVA